MWHPFENPKLMRLSHKSKIGGRYIDFEKNVFTIIAAFKKNLLENYLNFLCKVLCKLLKYYRQNLSITHRNSFNAEITLRQSGERPISSFFYA